jgi:heat shock protein HslJ
MTKSSRTWTILAAAVLTATFVSPGCGFSATEVDDTSREAGKTESAERGTGISGSDWTLIELGGVAAEPGTDGRKPSLSFTEGGKANGLAGCNRFTGGFVAGDGTLQFSPLAATRMACTTGMDQEMRYLQALDEVERFEIERERLTLFGAGKDALMKFEPRTGD